MLPLLGIAFGSGLVAGLLMGGSLRGLTNVRIAWPPVLFIALGIGLIPLFFDLDKTPRETLQLASHAGILIFLLANVPRARRGIRAGLAVAGLGWALNFIAIASNRGMPLSLWAYERSGQSGTPTPGRGDFFRIVIADEETWFKPLGDVIPVPPLEQVVSVGDILLIAGIAIVLAAAMRSGPPAAGSEQTRAGAGEARAS